MRETVEAARARAAQAEREFAALESSIAAEEAGEEDLDAGYEQAAAHLDRLEAELEELQEAERSAERDRQSFTARVDALDMSLRRKDGAAALLAAGDDTHTIAGSVASLVQVEAGHEAAVAAALGWAGDALAVDTLAGAAAAVDRLRSDDAGRAGLLVAETAGVGGPVRVAVAARAGRDGRSTSCRAPTGCARRSTGSSSGWPSSTPPTRSLALVRDGVTAVTRDGDVFGPGWVRGGSAAAPSLIEIQAAVDEARDRVTEAAGRGERARFAMASLRTRVAEASDAVEAALDQLHDSDAKMSAVAEKLGALGVAVRSARAEAERTERAHRRRRGRAGQRPDRARGLAERYEAAGGRARRRPMPTPHRRARPARRGRDRRPRPRDRAAARAAHPRGAGPRPARPRDRPRGGGRGRDRRPRPAPRPAGSAGCARRRWPRRSASAPPTPPGRQPRRRAGRALRRRAEEARDRRATPSSACCGATSPSSRTSCAS